MDFFFFFYFGCWVGVLMLFSYRAFCLRGKFWKKFGVVPELVFMNPRREFFSFLSSYPAYPHPISLVSIVTDAGLNDMSRHV